MRDPVQAEMCPPDYLGARVTKGVSYWESPGQEEDFSSIDRSGRAVREIFDYGYPLTHGMREVGLRVARNR